MLYQTWSSCRLQELQQFTNHCHLAPPDIVSVLMCLQVLCCPAWKAHVLSRAIGGRRLRQPSHCTCSLRSPALALLWKSCPPLSLQCLQVLVRYALDRGCTICPKATSHDHIKVRRHLAFTPRTRGWLWANSDASHLTSAMCRLHCGCVCHTVLGKSAAQEPGAGTAWQGGAARSSCWPSSALYNHSSAGMVAGAICTMPDALFGALVHPTARYRCHWHGSH